MTGEPLHDPLVQETRAHIPTPQLSEAQFGNVHRTFGALNSPLRLRLILLLADREHFVNEMAERLDKSQPLVSQHLRILKLAKIVDFERQGRETIYRLIDRRVIAIINLTAELTAPEPAHQENHEEPALAEADQSPDTAPVLDESDRARLVPAPHTSHHRSRPALKGGVLAEPDHEDARSTPALVPTADEPEDDPNTDEA